MDLSQLGVKWKERGEDNGASLDLAARLQISPILARILQNRKIVEESETTSYITPRLQELPDPGELAGMSDAVNRLEKAIDGHEVVGIFGDYDVDGVTSTTILSEFLEALGARVVTTIPNRLLDGYGLSTTGVDRLVEAGAQLIVTVDCGVTAVEEVAYAKQKNIDVIVIDHHTVPVALPEAVAVINPHRLDCHRDAEHLCAVGVTFNLCAALRRHLREREFFAQKEEPDIRSFLDLVALGTVADVVPLVKDNRVMVYHGLKMISRQHRPGLTALLEVSGVQPERVNSGHLGFQLGPRINAAGRLSDAGLAVTLFRTYDLQKARRLAQRLDQENQARRSLEQQITEEAIDIIESNGLHKNARVLVVGQSHWHPGVVGIVASRLVDRFGRPTIVIGEGGKGSGRSIPSFHLHEALVACSSYLLGFGGHAHAAGVQVEMDRITEFALAMNEWGQKVLPIDELGKIIYYDQTLDMSDVSFGMIADLTCAAPYGRGNPEPVFRFNNVSVQNIRVLKELHLKGSCSGAAKIELIAFGMAEKEAMFDGPIDILAVPQINRWRGQEILQLRVRDARPAGGEL